MFFISIWCMDELTRLASIEMQIGCMWKLIRYDEYSGPDENIRRTELVDDGDDERVVCQWNGVTCDTHEFVETIRWKSFFELVVDMHWIPSTAKNVRFFELHMLPNTLDTRRLARDLVNLQAVSCGLTGTIDTTHLPVNLEVLNLGENGFIGTVDLENLPVHLRQMGFMGNRLSEVIVSPGLLPPRFEKGDFFQMGQKVRFVGMAGFEFSDNQQHDPRLIS